MKTDQLADFDSALTAYRQPKKNNYLGLQSWVQVSAGGEWGVSKDVPNRLNKI